MSLSPKNKGSMLENLEKVLSIINSIPEALLLNGTEDEIEHYLTKQGIYFFESYEEAQ